MKSLRLSFALPAFFAASVVNSPIAHAADAEITGDSGSEFSFSLVPKAFQRNPRLDMTVFTEMTPAGRLAAPASPDHPVYYVVQAGGYRQFGQGYAGEHQPPVAVLERVMKKALASKGYLPAADPAHRPTLLVVFNWGSHNRVTPETASISPDAMVRNVMERALLVGGSEFARAVGQEYEQSSFGAINVPSFADASFSFTAPLRRLADGDAKLQYLQYQIHEDVYFVIASAYDYASVAQGHRTLLWRTNMTANTAGVSMRESLPPLIATAAPFFGRETVAPEALSRRINRHPQVDIGQATVVEFMDSTAPTAAPAPTESKPDASKP
jgi:hypothetical protein